MKNRAFTLIEVIAVITILALLSLVAVTTVTKTIRNSRDTTYRAQMNSILESAISYVATSDIDLPSGSITVVVSLEELTDAGFVDSSIYNNEYYNTSGKKVKFSKDNRITIKVSTSTPKVNEKYDGNYLYTLEEPK